MPRSDWQLSVQDILKAVERVETFTRGLTLETFVQDERTIAAVSYELVVIGEAAKNVPAAVRSTAPDVPWQAMSDMRNESARCLQSLSVMSAAGAARRTSALVRA